MPNDVARRFRFRAMVLAIGAVLMTGAANDATSAGRTFGFALTNVYIPAYRDVKACSALSLGSTDIFLQSLSAAERAEYAAPEKGAELLAMMKKRLGFVSVRLGTGPDGGGPPPKLTSAQVDALRAQNAVPAGKGAVVFRDRVFAYDSCTNPEDFPSLAKEHQEYRGDVAYGINLDGKVSRGNFTSPTGEQGIDNALFRALGCDSQTISYGDPKVADGMVNSSSAPTLVEISGVDDERNDDDVTVRVYVGAEQLENAATGKALAWSSIDIDPDPRYQATVKGRIVDGFLSTDPFDVRIRMKEQVMDTSRDLRGARIRAKITPGQSIEGGIYGYYTLASLAEQYVQFTQATADVSKLSCPATINAIKVNADGYRDPKTRRFTAISSAFNFRGVPAYLIHKDAAQVAENMQDRSR